MLPVDEAVEGPGEGGEFVLGGSDGQVSVRSPVAEVLGAAAHPGDRTEGEPGEDPGGAGERGDGEQGADDERTVDAADGLLPGRVSRAAQTTVSPTC